MPQSFAPLLYVAAFLAVVVVVQFVAGVVFSRGDRTRKVNRRLDMLHAGMKPTDVYSALVRRSAAPKGSSARLLAIHERVDNFCRQAGLAVTPLRLLVIAAGGAGGLWLISLVLLHSSKGIGLLLNGAVSAIAACVLSVMAVWYFVSRLRNKRLKALEEQMPLALDIVNRAIRAGHPVVSAVQLAADELGDPIGTEFGLIVDETTYGSEFREALTSFARRTGSSDAHFFAVSVGIQSETGGNLAEILAGLAVVIRARSTLAKRVKSLASEGKASANLLSFLPIGLIGFMFIIQPKFYTSKFSDPVFWPVVAGIVCLYMIGQFILGRIVNFKY
jgi:tight adherence protein B